MWKVNGWQTTDAKWWQKLTLARWAKNVYKIIHVKAKSLYFTTFAELWKSHTHLVYIIWIYPTSKLQATSCPILFCCHISSTLNIFFWACVFFWLPFTESFDIAMLLILGNDLYNQLWFSPGTAVESGVKQGSKLMDAMTLNASGFFHIASENCHRNDKRYVCIYISASVAQKLYLSTFVLFRNLCFLFLILE